MTINIGTYIHYYKAGTILSHCVSLKMFRCFLLCCIAGLPLHAFSQTTPALPAFYPIAEHSYGVKDGLPDVVVEKVLLDKTGRMHILTKGGVGTALGEWYYEYDGVRTYPAGLKIRNKPHSVLIDGKDALGRFYGRILYMNRPSIVFLYDPITKVSREIEFDKWVSGVVEKDGVLLVLVGLLNSSQYEISEISENKVTSILKHDIAGVSSEFIGKSKRGITNTDFWIATSSKAIYRINKYDGTVKRYALPGKERDVIQIETSPNNDLWITLRKAMPSGFSKSSIAVYLLDLKTESFTINPYKPSSWKNSELSYAMAFKDAKGNILVSYRNKNEEASATLVDTQGDLFDYTQVMDSHELVSGENFKQGIIFHLPNLRFVEVAFGNAVQKNTEPQKPPRQMIELNDQTIYLGPSRFLSNQEGAWKFKEDTIPCLVNASNETRDLKMDKSGHIWFIGRFIDSLSTQYKLAQYRPEEGLCDTFDLGGYLTGFDFMSDGQLVLATADSVYSWDKLSGKTQPIIKLANKGTTNQIFAGNQGFIWLATREGLLKIDPKKESQEWIRLKPGKTTNVMRIHQDKQGRLWLATVQDGVIIYEPSSGKTQVIDETKGLSNNIVVSLLEDNDGNIWAGTFIGITVLSPEGGVIGRLYEEDGLANNECNRWSALKMKDGRLCFGSVGGISIIDPVAWKSSLEGYVPPVIYLTELYSDAEGQPSDRNDHLSLFEEKKAIELPATNRNLKVAFGFSNYASPEKNTFAYQIEGVDKNWHFLGAQRKLALNALPAGTYNILLKGSDGRGQWSQPIVIPVQVEEFFYKKWWFFVLCTLPFVAFFILWQSRQLGERKRLETEVMTRTAIIREQSKKLLELDQAKTRLYTNITHEFRTPLTVITGMAEEIEKQPANAKHLIIRNARNLLRLVNQMLDLSKVESGELNTHWQLGDVVMYMQYIIESFQSYAATKNIEMTFHPEVKSLVMDYDPEKLQHVVINLLSNAIKFTPEKGKILCHLSGREGKELIIKVEDTGIGIKEEQLPHIFDRFYQVDSTHPRKGEGTGIGLALTKELIVLMGGSISVESTLGEGSVFEVVLPIHREAEIVSSEQPVVDSALSASLSNVFQTDSEASLKDDAEDTDLPLLLLIEDNADVASFIKSTLKGHYQILYAENGQLGIDKAFNTIPDVIVSDVMMPEKDGFEVTRTLKNDERTSHIPIVLLTAKADVASKIAGLERGADAYLAKPFDKKELLVRLKMLIQLRKKLQARYAGANLLSLGSANTITTEAPAIDPDIQIEDAFLKKVNEIIKENLSDGDFEIPQLCQLLHMSQSQLYRKIKALTDKSIASYIRTIRLHKGMDLLKTTDLSVSEITYEVGFTNPAYFSRAFSKEFGTSPNGVRN